MACYTFKTTEGSTGIICGNLGPPCMKCGGVSGFLCDYPVGNQKTCDRSLCEKCIHGVAPETHYCDDHYACWKDFEESGGVRKRLENVVPFKPEFYWHPARLKKPKKR